MAVIESQEELTAKRTDGWAGSVGYGVQWGYDNKITHFVLFYYRRTLSAEQLWGIK